MNSGRCSRHLRRTPHSFVTGIKEDAITHARGPCWATLLVSTHAQHQEQDGVGHD